jgi:hypothetical protein
MWQCIKKMLFVVLVYVVYLCDCSQALPDQWDPSCQSYRSRQQPVPGSLAKQHVYSAYSTTPQICKTHSTAQRWKRRPFLICISNKLSSRRASETRTTLTWRIIRWQDTILIALTASRQYTEGGNNAYHQLGTANSYSRGPHSCCLRLTDHCDDHWAQLFDRLHAKWEHHLQDMPVNDRPPGVLDHFAPVVGLLAAAAIAEEDPTDGTGGADTIVVADDQLQVDTLTAVDKCLEGHCVTRTIQ